MGQIVVQLADLHGINAAKIIEKCPSTYASQGKDVFDIQIAKHLDQNIIRKRVQGWRALQLYTCLPRLLCTSLLDVR